MGVYDFNTSSYNIDEIIRQLKHELQSIVINSQTSITEIKRRISDDEALLNRLKEAVDGLPDYTAQYTELKTELTKLQVALNDIIEHPIILDSIDVSGSGRICTEVQKINNQLIYAEHAVNDASGRNIVDTYATKEELSEIANAEKTAREEADDALLSRLNEETEDRTAADTEITNNLSAAVSGIYETFAAEYEERTAADEALHDAITAETTRATEEENQIKSMLASATGDFSEEIEQLYNALETESSARRTEDALLQQNIDDEVSNRASAINELQGALNEEEQTRMADVEDLWDGLTSATQSLLDTIDSETSALSEALTTTAQALQDSITAEESARFNADTALSEALATTAQSLQNSITTEESERIASDTALQSALHDETTARVAEDNNLQSQIDTIEATQNVIDLVGTYADLQDYNISAVKENDKIQVLDDSTHDDQTTIYSWKNNAWSYIGMLGPYYTKSQVDSTVSGINSAIDDEISRATSAEADIISDLSDEIRRATSAEADIISDLSDEINRASAAELVLTNTKQNNLTAGDGIDITDDVVSHSVKVIENNDEEDTVDGTVFTVYLKNNHYKVIDLDPEITEMHFMIEQSPQGVLQETGFEFTVPEDSDLETLSFNVIDDANKKIYTIIPDSYMSPNIYQGTIVNYRCTIGEYEVED